MAAQQPARSEGRALDGAVLLKRLQRILRARRLKAAGVAQPGLEEKTIALHQRHQQALRKLLKLTPRPSVHQSLPRGWSGMGAASDFTKRSSSSRAARRKA
jgi:hypothetical protein